MHFDIVSAFGRVGAAAALSLLAGCAGGADVSAISAEGGVARAGTLQIPLLATTPSGVEYRLRNAVFEITNPFVSPPVHLELPADADTLTLELPRSAFDFDYSVLLRDGWELRQVAADGSERPVNATLVSANPTSFTIRAQRTTPVTYQFRANSGVVTTGDGALSISVSVDDSLIDDFEDGDGELAAIGRRNGGWFTFNDGSGLQVPAPDTEVVPQVLDASADLVLHTTGEGFSPATLLPDGTFAFGAGVGAILSVDEASGEATPHDASGYAGIAFSFSISFPSSTPVQLSFLVGTSATTPVDDGGTCTDGCFDDFGFVGSIPVSPFSFSGVLPFEALTQGGFGAPASFDPAAILSLKWIIAFPDVGQPASANRFDFQLDDVGFAADGQGPLLLPPPATPMPAAPLASRAVPGARVSSGDWPQ